MKCEIAQQNMIFAGYGELHDEQIDGLEEHLAGCEACRKSSTRSGLSKMPSRCIPCLSPPQTSSRNLACGWMKSLIFCQLTAF